LETTSVNLGVVVREWQDLPSFLWGGLNLESESWDMLFSSCHMKLLRLLCNYKLRRFANGIFAGGAYFWLRSLGSVKFLAVKRQHFKKFLGSEDGNCGGRELASFYFNGQFT